MKNMAVILFLLIFPHIAFAQGQYDGIWYSPAAETFATVHQKGSAIAFVLLGDSEENIFWEAQAGSLRGNVLTTKTIYGYVDLTLRVEFLSSDSARITISKCEQTSINFVCRFPEDVTFNASKIF